MSFLSRRKYMGIFRVNDLLLRVNLMPRGEFDQFKLQRSNLAVEAQKRFSSQLSLDIALRFEEDKSAADNLRHATTTKFKDQSRSSGL